MFNFRNDYHDLCHPEIWRALLRVQDEGCEGYGYDAHSEAAREKISAALGASYPVHFVPGGTAANTLAIGFVLRPHEAVISADSGHIVGDEVGAIEAGGHKIITVETEDGKFDPARLQATLESFGNFHNVLPGMIYLSNATETGLVYTKDELRRIKEIADEHGVSVYIDGARMASALTSPMSDVELSEYPEFADIFSIGGTKNGALFGEALVFSNKRLADEFIYFQKQRSLLLAKGFTLGVQFETLFTDDLFFEIGRKANEMAFYLEEVLHEAGFPPYRKVESNQVFVELPADVVQRLDAEGQFEVFAEGDPSLVRLVTTYRTTKEEIDGFGELLRSL
ncbi:threonine aldolase [Peptoniphilus ivorii]|uniref:threonine aldolase family protein n=1 Tax=Aedoeadaptatus ivorii TaxID=54006 RepID=UPI00278570A2|nr:aminotransferase class I/II-fold pyridoxal phosphate-dependent enzyme [Peptoniphilus ivorii]MDQ0508293.1 threonine aldolase [Peptoniphilus ivorii]